MGEGQVGEWRKIMGQSLLKTNYTTLNNECRTVTSMLWVCRTVGPSLATSLENLVYCHIV